MPPTPMKAMRVGCEVVAASVASCVRGSAPEESGPAKAVPMAVPRADREHGAIRVGGTRVTLGTVICAFNDGDSPEEIAHSYSTLRLADVYAVVAYYLRHKEAVDDYLREREQEATALRRETERRFPPDGTRERLLARRNAG